MDQHPQLHLKGTTLEWSLDLNPELIIGIVPLLTTWLSIKDGAQQERQINKDPGGHRGTTEPQEAHTKEAAIKEPSRQSRIS